MKSIYLKAYLHIFCSFNIAWLHIYILFSFHTFFSFNIAFLLQFFFSCHITFLYSFSDLFYTFVADFALFKTVLEGVYLWAGPEWLILHEGRAQTVLLSNDILFCSSYKSTKRATAPTLLLFRKVHLLSHWSQYLHAGFVFLAGGVPSLSWRPSSICVFFLFFRVLSLIIWCHTLNLWQLPPTVPVAGYRRLPGYLTGMHDPLEFFTV